MNNGMSLTWNPQDIVSCYIINYLNGDTIIFATLPEDMSENYTTEWNSQTPMGRSAPFISYQNNGSRTVDFSVKLHYDICPDMMDVVKRLKGFTYPKYNGSLVQPPFCYVHFGNMVNMKAVINSISFQWDGTLSSDEIMNQPTGSFTSCNISFNFTELRIDSLPTVSNPLDEGTGSMTNFKL